MVAFMFCINSPTLLSSLMTIPYLAMMTLVVPMLWFSREGNMSGSVLAILPSFDVVGELQYLIFSVQGRRLVLAISRAVPMIICYAGAHIFSRKRSYESTRCVSR